MGDMKIPEMKAPNEMRKRITDAKIVSKWGMVVAVITALGYNIGYLIVTGRIPSSSEQDSILKLCGFIIVCFSPVYLNLFLDKIFGKKDN